MNAPISKHVSGPSGAQSAIARDMRDAAPAAACTLWDLRALVREELEAMLCERASAPALLTGAQLARELQISERTIFSLREEGLPLIRVGDSPRYVLADVLQWLRARSEGGAQ
jgi:hypothetical protein